MPPPEKTVLVHDSDNYICIHTNTGFINAVYGAASPEVSVEEVLKTYPPSAISKTYILPGNANYHVLKRTLAAFKGANYPNIKMVEYFSYMATAVLDGTDCEYDEGETLLFYSAFHAEIPEKGISMVLKKVDQLFQIIEYTAKNVHDVLNYYPEIQKVIISTRNSSVPWNMVIVDKTIKICKMKSNMQHEYVFNDHCRVKPITGIRILIVGDGAKIEPIDLFYEPLPVIKTVEFTWAPDYPSIHIWASHAGEPYLPDSTHEVASRPGHMTKLSVTVSIGETILPEFSYRVIGYIPQVMTEIVFDSSTGKYAGNLVKLTTQKNVITDCSTPDDVFAAFEALPTTDYHVGFIINYKNKFDMTVHKVIMALIPEHTKVWIIPLHTALEVDLRHSEVKLADDKDIVVWYHNTNSAIFYTQKGESSPNMNNEDLQDNDVKRVMVVTRNAISKSLSESLRKRFPAATIFNSNRETLPSTAHYDILWENYQNRHSSKHNTTLNSLGTQFRIKSNKKTINISKPNDYDFSCCTNIVPRRDFWDPTRKRAHTPSSKQLRQTA